MSSQRNEQLLREATEAAREGNRSEAKKLIRQILNNDDKDVKAWMLLYRVSDDTGEKRRALEKILALDPGNQRAQEALDKLSARIQQATEDEVAPGIDRRQLTRIGLLVGLVVVLLLGAVFIAITLSNNSRANEFAQQTLVAAQSTELSLTETAFAVQGTQSAADATAAFFAQNSPTPTATNTRLGPPTLPPEFTPTNTPLPAMTPTALPLPPGATGQIVAAGGLDIINDQYFYLYAFPLAGGAPRTLVSDVERRGRYVAGTQQTRIVYTLWSRQTFEFSLAQFDMTQGAITFLATLWETSAQVSGGNRLVEAQQPSITLDSSKVAFVGQDSQLRRQVYLLDFNDTDGDPLTRLTNDESNYSFPGISGDGGRIVVVRTDNNGNVDLVSLETATGQMRPVTTDGNAALETHPRFHPTENEIVYAAAPAVDGNHDLYIRAADGSGDVLNITSNTENSDEIFPVYSPDGRFIAFASNRTGKYNIFVYDRSDGSLYQVSNEPDSYYPGGWVE
jgi:tetrahydromethanopterin S-methyltransferase subunit G